MTLVNRKTREIVGYDIARDRSLQRIQNLVDNSPKAELYFSDAFRFIYRFVTKEFIALLTTNLKLLLLNLLMLFSDIIFLLFIVNPDAFFVLLILFSLSLKFSFLLSINFLLLNFVSIILNIISRFLRFYLNPHPCQLSWGSP